jgi:site-specific recombinase XerD
VGKAFEFHVRGRAETDRCVLEHWHRERARRGHELAHDLRKLFKDAGVTSEGNTLSPRLWDTFAVDLLEKGGPLEEEMSKLLGRESIKTERHYSKSTKGRPGQPRSRRLETEVEFSFCGPSSPRR